MVRVSGEMLVIEKLATYFLPCVPVVKSVTFDHVNWRPSPCVDQFRPKKRSITPTLKVTSSKCGLLSFKCVEASA
jgi:hypothetical protein